MDEKAVYFEIKTTSTINKGEKTVFVRSVSISVKGAILCVTVAADRTKLPLFVVFKGVQNGTIERILPVLLPDCAFGCTQEKRWMVIV